MTILDDLDNRISEAISHFWETRSKQTKKQISSGKTDTGFRGAVTGGKQMYAFEKLMVDIALESGISENSIFHSKSLELPGYFRPEKKWDLLIVDSGVLVAAIEFKSHIGPSFGNNFNNRTEEAIGNANDLWIAYREGALGEQIRPWLGYLMLLEDCPKSQTPVRVNEPHFNVFEEFREASYTKRYELLLLKLLRERYYDSACLLLSGRTTPYFITQPSHLLSAKIFFTQIFGHLKIYLEIFKK